MLISIQVSWLLLGWHTYKEQVTLLLDRLIDRASDLSMLSSTLTGMTTVSEAIGLNSQGADEMDSGEGYDGDEDN